MPASNDVPKDLIDFILDGTSFVVVGHEDPDGDCVGSQLALSSLLRRMGKKAIPCLTVPFKRTELKPFEKHFLPFPAKQEGLRVLIMDCSDRNRVGDIPIDGLPFAIIDHHATGEPWGQIAYFDPTASSVSLMVEKLFAVLGEEPTKDEALYLLFGICTDTGFFRHLDDNGAETFRTAAKLTAAGANPKELFDIINGGKPLGSRLLLGTCLAKTRPFFDGKLLVSDETLEELDRFGHKSRDSDILYQLLQSVEGVEAVVLIRQENAEKCTLGFRSRDRIDVSAIAKKFGGGGHLHAAGAKVYSGNIQELEKKIVEAFGEVFT